tara:strand:+ start:20269 stop:21297 length:1029 start_codon:yes stop_codon:yes gene_type:complete
MKLLFTGNYLPDYNRTAIIKKGLAQLGHTVFELPFEKKNKKIAHEIQKLAKNVDAVFLPCFTHKEVSFAKKHINGKPLIFDPLISRYLTKVYDYKLASPYSLSAIRNFYRDKTPMQNADLIFCDTKAHRNYFHQTFKIPLDKMQVLYIGNDFDKFYPLDKTKNKRFVVGFYGGFIPLQGVMTILQAAKALKHEDIEFKLIGNGFEYEKALKFIQDNQLRNVSTPGWLDEETLHKEICQFDIALGIFGDTLKSDLVIPNKVYHYASCGLPIINKDSPAIREIFTKDENILLVEQGFESLANMIREVRQNYQADIGKRAFELMRDNYNAKNIAETFTKSIEALL